VLFRSVIVIGSTLLLAACSNADSVLQSDAGVDLGEPESVAAHAPYVDYVNPFIGTGGLGYGTGSAYPGPQLPFGLAKPGPDTSNNGTAPSFAHCSGYSYGDSHIDAFSHTRMHGTGIVDYTVVSLMPTVGMSSAKTNESGYRSRFMHQTEEASPGYYAVTLADTSVRVELTATAHVGIHRWTFPANSDAVVVFDNAHAASDVEVIDAQIRVDRASHELSGYAHFQGGYSGRFGGMPVYFAARFSEPFIRFGVWQDGELVDNETARDGASTGAYVAFDVSDGSPIEGAVAISFVDVDHARMNLLAEAMPIDFDASRASATREWEARLAKVELAGRYSSDFERFYSALYHTLLMPTLAMDVDKSYRGMDREVHVASDFRYYTDFSLWDTFRTEHPLLTLLYPTEQRDMLKSMIAMANDGGYIDRWPLGIGYTGGMVGESAAIVFADSVAKGIDDIDVRAAYEALRSTAMGPVPAGARYGGRDGIEDYLALGYVPSETGGGSTSKTLEYAYDDFALARLSEFLGESSDQDLFDVRARNYRNSYDAAQGFMVARSRDGTFSELESAIAWTDDYTEGDAWQYVWYAPHDLSGLTELLGGRDVVLARLDDFFARSMRAARTAGPDPYYWHGNEPDLHAAFMYSKLGSLSRTAEITRWILASRYGNDEAGLPGNDDAGTMSAWFVFASAGIYPIAATPQYLLASPIFTRVSMHLAEGDLTIEAPLASEAALYPTSVFLDGVPVSDARVMHEAITGGSHTLHFEMQNAP
jgi:predicted alpha-1,2-mannosidase